MKILPTLIVIGIASILFVPLSVSASHTVATMSNLGAQAGTSFRMDITGTGFDNTADVSFTKSGSPTAIQVSGVRAQSSIVIRLSVSIPANVSAATYAVNVIQHGEAITVPTPFVVAPSGSGSGGGGGGGTVSAVGETPPLGFEIPTNIPTTGTAIIALIQTAGNWVFAIFLAISFIYILLAAFQFITGGGDPEQMSAARQKLIYAIMGIAVALIAAGIDDIVRAILGLEA